MEEGKDKLYSEETKNNMEQPAQEATANVEREAEVAANEQPASEEVAEPAKAEASVAEQPKQPAQSAARKPKKKGLTFGKAFLAALLAVVAGSALMSLFWLSLFSGIGAIMQPKKAAGVPAEAILHI